MERLRRFTKEFGELIPLMEFTLFRLAFFLGGAYLLWRWLIEH